MSAKEDFYQVLLIWEYVPENTTVYYLKVKKGIFDRMVKCHGLLINQIQLTQEQESNLNWLYDLTLKIEPIYSTMVNPESPAFNSEMREKEEIAHDGSEAIKETVDTSIDSDFGFKGNPIPKQLRELRTRKSIEVDTEEINTVHLIYSGYIVI